MKVFPGSSLLQITQGVASPGGKTPAADPTQFKAALRAAGPEASPLRQAAPRQAAATVRADRAPSEMPRENLPRGSLVDIRI